MATRRRNKPDNLRQDLSKLRAISVDSPASSRSTSPEQETLVKNAKLKLSGTGHATIIAPGTPFNEYEIDLGDTFISANGRHENHVSQSKPLTHKRRLHFIVGSLVGAAAVYIAVKQAPRTFDFEDFASQMPSLGLDSLSLPQLGGLPDFKDFSFANMTGLSKQWLQSTNFEVGRAAAERGVTKKHAVILIPGVISTGLESWSTDPVSSAFFRQRIWGTTSNILSIRNQNLQPAMLRAILKNKEAWIRAMSLDPITGLDPPGVKVRASQGFDAASYFINAGVVSYYIWARIVENLAAIGYDPSDSSLAAYDWRLSYHNLQVRDQYFSSLKSVIEQNLHDLDKKTVLISHSMGGQVMLYFFKWVEAEGRGNGNGGSDWVEKHSRFFLDLRTSAKVTVESWVNIAGSLLGVPKASAALLSGEMRDTVELNPAGVYILEKLFSRKERADMFRSWAGAASMLIKGGSAVWGDHNGAPDDPENATLTGGFMYRFMNGDPNDPPNFDPPSNLTVDDAFPFLLQNVPTTYAKMMETNYSHGIERDAAQVVANDADHRKWSNPLEVQLPKAPSMKIYCMYGVGKTTERAYFYQQDGFETAAQDGNELQFAQSLDPDSPDQSENQPFPRSRKPPYIDSTVNLETNVTTVKNGVINGEGDGTVGLLSLGAMCVEGWKRPIYNPAGIKIITREIKHEPQSGDLRGGTTTADHVDILGNSELNEAILQIVAGQGDQIEDRIYSDIRKFSSKIRW